MPHLYRNTQLFCIAMLKNDFAGVMIGLVAATCAATGWQWYAASLEVHYHEVQGVQTSLIFQFLKEKSFF